MTRRTIRTATAVSALSLAIALATPAAAQSFNGTGTVTFGSATISEGTGTTDVTVNSSSAVIDWAPDDTAINNGAAIGFQNAGTTAAYNGSADYAVLNRIVPVDATRPIVFDGTVLSRVAGAAGGTVFFYSPGGIIVGSNAIFDVGNLGLTTAEPLVDPSGNWYAGNTVQFQQAASGSEIIVRGQITASAQGSYVAAFAPFVDVGGTTNGSIDANGQVALVAAEAGSITFSPDGLFDIQVTIGTDGNSGTGIIVDGSITGASSTGAGDNHAIYMVAIPKNQALTLAIAGADLGFDVAGAANVVGNRVVLSAGHNIAAGQIEAAPAVAGNAQTASIQISDQTVGSLADPTNVTSALYARATGGASIFGTQSGSYASDVVLEGAQGASVYVNSGTTTFGGDLTVSASLLGTFRQPTASNANLQADTGGAITVAGDVFVLADNSSTFANGSSVADAQSRTGGTATLLASNGGSLNVGGSARVSARGEGGSQASNGTQGSGTGGQATIQAFQGGALSITGDANVDASGQASTSGFTYTTGGSGTGGNAQILATNGNATVTVGGDAFVRSAGTGSFGGFDAPTGSGGAAGAGTGGLAEIGGDGGTGNAVTVNGFASVYAQGFGGGGVNAAGGNGTGGRAIVSGGNGTAVTIGSGLLAEATGSGGDVTTFGSGIAAAGTKGGDAFGGSIEIRTFNAGGSIDVTGDLVTYANAFGGFEGTLGDGGNATAGFADISVQNGTAIFRGNLTMDSSAIGGSGINGGNAIGGFNDPNFRPNLNFFVRNGSLDILGTTVLNVEIAGGSAAADTGGIGGNASRGSIAIVARSDPNGGTSAINLHDVLAAVDVVGGDGGSVASGTGGAGGSALPGNQQSPTGGTILGTGLSVLASAGTGQITINGDFQAAVSAEGGFGGDGDIGGAGGSAEAGLIEFGTISGIDTVANDGFATVSGNTLMAAVGTGGDGGTGAAGAGGDGGDGINGVSIIIARGTPVTLAGNTQLFAAGIGGNGGTGVTDGDGGNGIVGNNGGIGIIASSRFNQPDNRGTLNGGTIVGQAFAQGGTGGTPGVGIVGEQALTFLFNGADANIDSVAFSVVGGQQVTATNPEVVTLINSNVNVGNFSLFSPNDLALTIDGSTLATDSFQTQSRSVVVSQDVPVDNPGTISATTALDIIVSPGAGIATFTNFQTDFGFFLAPDGNLIIGDVTAVDFIDLRSANGIIETGSLSSGGISLAAAGEITAGNITATRELRVDSGDVIYVDGVWTAPFAQLLSDDIDIDADEGESITADVLQIASTNIGGMVVGGDRIDNLTGYALDNSEFGTLSARELYIFARDVNSSQSSLGTVDMTIDDLTIRANQLGPDGFVVFGTGNPDTLAASGRIRVDGNITGTGFADQSVEFYADVVEVNAETGGVFLSGISNGDTATPPPLGGFIVMEANNIHVASDEILLRLRDNPLYDGHVEDLNQPGNIDRPDGVISAFGLEFYPGETLYIQNTGTAANPAGFYTTIDGSDIDPFVYGDNSQTTPSVEVVINGRFATDAGDVGGQQAYQLIVDNADSLDGFSEFSQVNGCAFASGSCSFVGGGEGESPPPTQAAEIEVLTEDQAEEEPFDTDEEEEEAEQAARAPIAPPVVLINTSPLNPDVDVTDPVSGTGNPALIGASISQDAQGDQ